MKVINNQKGISFAEILIAIVIFAMTITAMVQGLIFGNRRIRAATYRTAAIIRVQERLEQMKNDTFANITEANYLDDNPILDSGVGITCARDVTITGTNYKTITVTVSYTYRGRQYQESITTIRSP